MYLNEQWAALMLWSYMTGLVTVTSYETIE